MRRPTLLASLLLLPAVVFASDGWERINKEAGVTVYSKEIEGSDLVAFKGVTTLDAPLAKVLAVLMDNDRRIEWVDRLADSELVETVSPFEFVIYQHFALPLIITDRDYVYRGKASQDEEGRVTLSMSSCEHAKAPETVGVRANLINSRYLLIPDGDKTRLEVEIHTDPKGMIPTWLVNALQKSWPSKTLSGVRSQLEKGGLEDYPLPPVTKAKKKAKKATTVAASTAKKP